MYDPAVLLCPWCDVGRLRLAVDPGDRRQAQAVCDGCGWASEWRFLIRLRTAPILRSDRHARRQRAA